MFSCTVPDSRARSPVPAGSSGPALLLRGDAQQGEALRPHQQGLPASGTPDLLTDPLLTSWLENKIT